MKRKQKKEPSWIGKEGHKGQKCLRGVPVNKYGELKKKITVNLTPTAIAILDELSKKEGISRSEIVELFLREQVD